MRKNIYEISFKVEKKVRKSEGICVCFGDKSEIFHLLKLKEICHAEERSVFKKAAKHFEIIFFCVIYAKDQENFYF